MLSNKERKLTLTTEYKMKQINNIPTRIKELMKKHNIKTNYKNGILSKQERDYIIFQIMNLQGKK